MPSNDEVHEYMINIFEKSLPNIAFEEVVTYFFKNELVSLLILKYITMGRTLWFIDFDFNQTCTFLNNIIEYLR